MGYYIETGPVVKGKADYIAKTYDGVKITQPVSFKDIPDGKALIMVVENEKFDAAAFVYDEIEFRRIVEWPVDFRPRKYVLMDREKAEELTKFKERKRHRKGE